MFKLFKNTEEKESTYDFCSYEMATLKKIYDTFIYVYYKKLSKIAELNDSFFTLKDYNPPSFTNLESVYNECNQLRNMIGDGNITIEKTSTKYEFDLEDNTFRIPEENLDGIEFDELSNGDLIVTFKDSEEKNNKETTYIHKERIECGDWTKIITKKKKVYGIETYLDRQQLSDFLSQIIALNMFKLSSKNIENVEKY